MKIIGFGHRKRVGKDRATQFAMNFARMYRTDINTQILSFGNIIKHYAHSMYGWGGLQDAAYYENHGSEIEVILPAIGKSPRQIWDKIGLMGREINDKTWVQLALENLEADLLICKDVRGWSEFNLIREVGGLTIKLTRAEAPLGGEVDSILDSAKWDLTFDNDKDLRSLNLFVQQIVGEKIDLWFPPKVKR